MRNILLLILSIAFTGAAIAQERSLLLQRPSLSKTQIAFNYAGDLWIVARNGGEATRLTSGVGIETAPIFSPDGTKIAFTGQYDGNTDVFVVPASGGVPQRLTWHPGPDVAISWTPDGKNILFRSPRSSYSRFQRLFTIPAEGGVETEVPLPMADDAAYSPDGTKMAYTPLAPAFAQWKNYRGGRTSKIWIATLADSTVVEIPRQNSNDYFPMWSAEQPGKVWFLSDRNGRFTLFSYDTATKRVVQAIKNDGPGALDIKSAQVGPEAIVYEQFGEIKLYDLKSGQSKKVDITLSGDLASVRPRYERVAGRIANVALSPTGARALFEARGEIISVPADKGNARNLTNSPGVADRDPAWSPDGKWIAYFSDESGEYALHLRNQTGMGEVKKISLGNPSSYFYSPIWSPDSKKIAFTDKRLILWYVDIEKGTPVKVDTNTYENPYRVMDPDWSPDSKWIAYSKQLKSRMCAAFAYSIDTGKTAQITDGLSDVRYVAFDKSGKYLYFTASTDNGMTNGWLDMSSFPHPTSRSVYLAVLKKGDPSPLAPESDEEKVAEEKKEGEKKEGESAGAGEGPKPAAGAPVAAAKPGDKKEPPKVTIDFDGIQQRILALPIPARNFAGLGAGKANTIFLAEASGPGGLQGNGGLTIHKFDLEKRKLDKVQDGVTAFVLSANGEKMLVGQGFGPAQRYTIMPTMMPAKPGEGVVKTDEMEVYVDPQAEWRQMYNEVWRIQRDFFYDPTLHGLDYEGTKKRYEAFLAGIAHREDLNYLFREMLGNMSVGHHNSGGGDAPNPNFVATGLLGADYKVENGRYRFAKIYNGENWNPQLRAPLTQPGVEVKTGDYLIAVNGRDVRATDNVHSFFESKANKQVVIKVSASPDGKDAKEYTVVPVASDQGLRNLDWIESNRRKVDELSGGKLAYVYLPDTAGGGYTNFNRYYFAQIDKDGAVIDERFNGGGTAADYIIDYMRRPLLNKWATREGEDFATPSASIYGPKVMIVNEYAGSGGDMLPWMFRKAGVGTLVGKRTWGGLVGIYDYPQLIDGGSVTAPRVAFYNLQGQWDVENYGTPPDIEVDFDPAEWRKGRDTQLEKAVAVAMDQLKKKPLPTYKKPAYPNYNNGLGPLATQPATKPAAKPAAKPVSAAGGGASSGQR